MRPSWDTYYIGIAGEVAKRSTCDRARVGTVLVRDKRILSTGFNGSLPSLPHCDEVGHLMQNGHCVRTVHSEANAIIQAALHGVSTAGATAYVTHFPCLSCGKMLVNAGVERVGSVEAYREDAIALDLLDGSGLEIACFQASPNGADRVT